MSKTSTSLIGLCCLLVGLAAGYGYQAWQFKYKAFGHKIEYGLLSPEYGYAELLDSNNLRARDASLQSIVQDKMQSHEIIAKKLETLFGNDDPVEIPPMAALAMGRFDLSRYLQHPDANQRRYAVFASRWWHYGAKLNVLQAFLDDEDKFVVDQAIYEIGYIGDKSALEMLSDARFDGNSFIHKVREALESGSEFR